MAKPKNVLDANSKLNEMLPQALLVVHETIHGIESQEDAKGEAAGWKASSLNTSLWLIEKLTGKPKTEEASNNDGLLRELLQVMNDRKALAIAPKKNKQRKFSEKESTNKIDSFVDDFGEE